MNFFIFGVGYSARTFAHAHAQTFEMSGCVRSPDKVLALNKLVPDLKIYALSKDGEAIARALSQCEVLLASAPPDPTDPALASFGAQIEQSPLRTIIYLSTIGVYGDSGGAWIDEATPPAPANARTTARIAAEEQWARMAQRLGARLFVLRLAGIYGPGRSLFDSLRDGTARRIVKKGQVFNRIFVDDISSAIFACISSKSAGGVFNICDDAPAPPQDVIAYGAEIGGFAQPPQIAFEDAVMGPMAKSFWSSCKRVSNAKAKSELDWRPKYKNYREGLAAILELR